MNIEAPENGPEKEFFDFLSQGEFMIQRSKSSGEYIFYPRVALPKSGIEDLEWGRASGKGVVYATSVVLQRPEKGGVYNVALIDLEEGPRLMSRVEGCAPESVVIGMDVVAEIDLSGSNPVLIFKPV